jgi:hypothetical protein
MYTPSKFLASLTPAQLYRHEHNIVWHRHPEFEDSLRELVGRQNYTLDDAGMMFGLTRERIRQLCWKYNIATHRASGVHNIRIWNDVTHEFEPSSRGAWTKQKRVARGALRRAVATARINERRAEMVTCLLVEAASIGRPLSAREMTIAWFGAAANVGYLGGLWGRVDGATRKGVLPAIRLACGWPPGVTGQPKGRRK